MLSEQDKVRTRHHLGYLNVDAVSTFVLGIPAAVQTQFMIEGAFNRVLPQAEGRFRSLLDKLDELENQIVCNSENVEVSEVGEIKLRPDAFKEVIKRYKHWQGALCNMLGVTANPFDFRPYFGSESSVNINVV